MMKESKYLIGVTGHRDLRVEDLPILRAIVREILEEIRENHAEEQCVMLNSIAEGADTLCAQEALAVGMKLICPLPMSIEAYRDDFSGHAMNEFNELLAEAAYVYTAPEAEPSNGSRDHGYRQASIHIAEECDALIALWDGSAPKPMGCGTAEAVGFFLNGRKYRRRTDELRTLFHVELTRRSGRGSGKIHLRRIIHP